MSKDLHIAPFEYELIEAKLDGTLTAEQMQVFRDLESQDPDWSLKVEEVKTLRQDLESYLLKTELDKIHKETFPGKNPKTVSLPRWIGVAAASIALILVGWLGYETLFDSPTEKLFEAYYETDPGLITAMSGTASYEFDRGMVDFKEGKYREALQRWEPLLNEKPNGDTLLYFVAMANLELGKYVQSQELLQELLEEDPSEFAEDGRWYLALIYLKNGETDKAKSLLSTSQRPEAEAILEELE